MQLKYAIIGSGGIGGLYGGFLAKSGYEVHFLLRSDYDFVKQNGLQIDSVKGDFHLSSPNVYKEASAMPVCDVVLVCLKTIQNKILKDLLPSILHKNSVVILVQNGLGIEKELSDIFTNVSVAGATAFVCTTKVGPGHIHHAEYGTLTIAKYCGDCDMILNQVADDFINAGIQVNLSDDLNSIRWKKLVWNIPYNGLTVVLNAATDELTFNTATRSLVIDLMNEVVDAGRICGAKISDSFVSKMIEMTEKMTPYSPSMRLDYEARRPMEIQTMYTNPIKIAKEKGFEMKKTQMLEQQLRFISDTQQTVKE